MFKVVPTSKLVDKEAVFVDCACRPLKKVEGLAAFVRGGGENRDAPPGLPPVPEKSFRGEQAELPTSFKSQTEHLRNREPRLLKSSKVPETAFQVILYSSEIPKRIAQQQRCRPG